MGQYANYADIRAMKHEIAHAVLRGSNAYLDKTGKPYSSHGRPALSVWVDYDGNWDTMKNEFAAHSFKIAVQWSGFDEIERSNRFQLVKSWVEEHSPRGSKVLGFIFAVDSNEDVMHTLDGESRSFENQEPVLYMATDKGDLAHGA